MGSNSLGEGDIRVIGVNVDLYGNRPCENPRHFALYFTLLHGKISFKVAEHSFRSRSCWGNSARARGLQKQTCHWYSDHFICSIPALSFLFFFVIERSVLMALVFLNKGMLKKVRMQRTQQFSDFSKSKEPSKMQWMRSCSKNWHRLLLQKLDDF